MGTREAIDCLAARIEALEAALDDLMAKVQAIADAERHKIA
jgi:BMFP domain-containing protein YqiC